MDLFVKLIQVACTYGFGIFLLILFLVLVIWALQKFIENTIQSVYARLINNFGLYNQNRHQAYAKLYELLLRAEEKLVHCSPILTNRYPPDELETRVRDAEREVTKAVSEFHNEFLRNELYLSDAVSAKLQQIDDEIRKAVFFGKWLEGDEYTFKLRSERMEKLKATLETIKCQKEGLRTQMQSEMSVGQKVFSIKSWFQRWIGPPNKS